MAQGRKRAVAKWVRRGLVALLLLGAAAGLWLAYAPRPVEVDVVRASRGPLRVTVDEDGRARVKDRYVVSAPLLGNLERVEVHPGDEVQAGAVLARILPAEAPLLDPRARAEAEARVRAAEASERQARAAIERASAALDLSRRRAETVERLAATGASPAREAEDARLEQRARAAELESARFGARVSAYELETARAALSRLSAGGRWPAGQTVLVTSPVAGRVLRVLRESAGLVTAGTQLLEVGNPAALEIVSEVLSTDAVGIRPGARVEVDRWGGERALSGAVRLVEPSAFTRTSALGIDEQRVNVLVDLTDPPAVWSALGDGYQVEVHVVVWEGADVLRLPASALFREGERWAVFAVRDGRAWLTPVRTGKSNGLTVEVTGGLGPGDVVVARPSDRVRDGVAVRAR